MRTEVSDIQVCCIAASPCEFIERRGERVYIHW
jgi:hypothetical protein